MKLIMVLGGLIGFAIGLGFSWAQGGSWPAVVWRAAVTALLGGVLLRWWGQLWVQCLRDAQKQSLLAQPKREVNSNSAQK